MRPHLIVDFRSRSLFALVVTADGRSWPCSHEVNGRATRYVSSELLLDSWASGERPRHGRKRQAGLLDLAANQQHDLAGCARGQGLLRPWEIPPGTETLAIRHPLLALSSIEAMVDEAQQKSLRTAAFALMTILLEPVFRSVSLYEIEPSKTLAVAIVPAPIGRRAGLILHKIFRDRGFRRLILLPREVAAVMASEEASPSGNLILDVEEDDLQLHNVTLEADEHLRRYRVASSRTLRGLGWSFLVEQLADALRATGRLPGPKGVVTSRLDRALTGLAGGPYPAEVSGETPLQLTYGLLDEALQGDVGSALSRELQDRLRPMTQELGNSGCPLVVLGPAAGIRQVEAILRQALGACSSQGVFPKPALERCARGVAAMLDWLQEDPRRHVTVRTAASLRVNTLRGESLELIPAAALPREPGTRRLVRQTLAVQGQTRVGDTLVINLLWGCNLDPASNTSICALPLEIRRQDLEQRPTLRLTLDLQRGRTGRRLTGTARASLGISTVSGKLELPTDDSPILDLHALTS
jgi:hypothetical protein